MSTRGVKQSGDTLLGTRYPKHPLMMENVIWLGVMMHSSTSAEALALQGESKAWCLQEPSLSVGHFNPIAARSVHPSFPDATTAELPKDVARVVFTEQHTAFPQSLVWQGTGGDLAEECQPLRPVCPVRVFLFG